MTIVSQAYQHAYDEVFVANINRSIINNAHMPLQDTQQPGVMFLHPLPYHNAIRPIRNALLKHNRTLPYAHLNTVFHAIKNNKPPITIA